MGGGRLFCVPSAFWLNRIVSGGREKRGNGNVVIEGESLIGRAPQMGLVGKARERVRERPSPGGDGGGGGVSIAKCSSGDLDFSIARKKTDDHRKNWLTRRGRGGFRSTGGFVFCV